jgi:hypothetical protein
VTDHGVIQLRHVPLVLGVACAGPLACDGDFVPAPDDPEGAELDGVCPELPPDVEPIAGLSVAHAVERFGGVTLTLSSRALSCGEPAAQHDRGISVYDRGLTVGLPAEQSMVGQYPLAHPLFIEFEQPGELSVGGGGELGEASIEIFAITDECVTGRIVGLVEVGGPFDGGFRAPRCTP